jgi:hypothetical protein
MDYMKKIYHFDSVRAPYIADAGVLTCFDHRIHNVVRKFLRRRGIEQPDMVVVAGGAKTLASPRNDFEQDFILEQLRMSICLHHTSRFLLTCHSDCATYGGLAFYDGDCEAEALHHAEELRRAARRVRATFPKLDVECYLFDFEGVWEVAEDATKVEYFDVAPIGA